MDAVAVGFMVLIAGAAFMGVVVGAIGGAVTWRFGGSLVLGGLITACAYLLALILEHPQDFIWLSAKVTWGIPATSVTFLIGSVPAAWLNGRAPLLPSSIAIATHGIILSMGVLYF